MGSIKVLLVWMLIANMLFGAKVTVKHWENGKTFSEYLDSREISQEVLKSVSEADLGFLSDIEGEQVFYELKDDEGTLEQVLIPIGTQMQIRLAKERDSGQYTFDIIPIEYKEQEYSAKVTIEQNLHSDIINTLAHPGLANQMGQLFKGVVNTKKFKKDDKISFLYSQKTRMGQPYDEPQIKIAMIESKDKREFIYADQEGYGYKSQTKTQAYTVKGKKKVVYTRRVPLKNAVSNFGMPLRHVRLSSPFSYRRYHPILKKYRPHLGTDFRAKRGTPLLAVNDGTVTYAGYMSGYGKVVKIRHAGGYESLYAHQSRTRAKSGQRVTKGQIIGYSGNSGRSTGPHLHFGLTKHGRWLNPMTVLSKRSGPTSILKKFTKYEEVKTTKYKEVVIKDAKKNKNKLLLSVKNKEESVVWDNSLPSGMKVLEQAIDNTEQEVKDNDV